MVVVVVMMIMILVKCRFCGRSTRPLTIWFLAALNWEKLKTSTATTRQLHTFTGTSAKGLGLN